MTAKHAGRKKIIFKIEIWSRDGNIILKFSKKEIKDKKFNK